MKTEIISIGSELICGKNLDTNAVWLSQKLAQAGIEVGYHSTVGDELDANVEVFGHALGRAELVLATGGLGPTADDLTRQALAQLADARLVFDQNSFDRIQRMFRKRNRKMPQSNRVQAYFPAGSIPIANEHGTAPGIWLEFGDRLIVCLPGVPGEMYPMFEDRVMPKLKERFAVGRAIVSRTLHCFGAGESHLEQRLGDLTRRGRFPEVAITASEATISLRITAMADSAEQAIEAIEPVADFIRRELGDLVFGEEDESLQSIVSGLLAEKNRTLATAESCTGGLVGHLLTEVPGISRHYLGGVVAYSNDAKQRFLGVETKLLETHGAVSPEVAAAMAEGCQERFDADLGVGITGIAGPEGGTPEKPVGLVYVALASSGAVRTTTYNWSSNRSSTKIRSAKTALNLVRLHLLEDS